jgi:lipoic acid synthetase
MSKTERPPDLPPDDVLHKTLKYRRLPCWLKKNLSLTARYGAVSSCVAMNSLHTVCTEARCPNRAECFSAGTATFLVLGNVCTRNCAFCGVHHGVPLTPDSQEPVRIAEAAQKLELRHIVITSVTRDDLPDGGAVHFTECVRQCRHRLPGSAVELLVPDFRGKDGALDRILDFCPDVFGHNIETVPRLYPRIRPKADYRHSLGVIARAAGKGIMVKSGMMAGLGETDEEIIAALRDLRAAGCRAVTIGQYLQPSVVQIPPERYISPERFRHFEEAGREAGLSCVVAGPYVRSSYRAQEVYATASARFRRNS